MNRTLLAVGVVSLALGSLAASPAIAQRRRPARVAPARRAPPPPIEVPGALAPPASLNEGPDPFGEPPTPIAPPVLSGPPVPIVLPVALDVAVGVQLTHRALRWSDDIFGELRPYTLPLAPWITLDATWFPGAHGTDGWLAHLGLYAGVGFAVGISSSDSLGRTYDTAALDLRGGLRGRLPVGPHSLLVGAGVELRQFTLHPPDDPNDPGVPSVSYASATLDVDARLRLTPGLALLLGSSAALPFQLGDLADRLFPNVSGAAVELRGGVAWAIGSHLELRAVAAYRRFFLALNPSPGDRWVAGGLVDEFASLSLAVAFRR